MFSVAARGNNKKKQLRYRINEKKKTAAFYNTGNKNSYLRLWFVLFICFVSIIFIIENNATKTEILTLQQQQAKSKHVFVDNKEINKQQEQEREQYNQKDDHASVARGVYLVGQQTTRQQPRRQQQEKNYDVVVAHNHDDADDNDDERKPRKQQQQQQQQYGHNVHFDGQQTQKQQPGQQFFSVAVAYNRNDDKRKPRQREQPKAKEVILALDDDLFEVVVAQPNQQQQQQKKVAHNDDDDNGDHNETDYLREHQQREQYKRYRRNAVFSGNNDLRHKEEEPERSVIVGGEEHQQTQQRQRQQFEEQLKKYQDQQRVEKLQQDKIGKEYFLFRSGNKDYDDAYKLAIDEIKLNIDDTGGNNGWHFIAGAGWTELWTRDTSYAIELGAGLLFPEVSKRSLMKCTELIPSNKYGNKLVWLQDTCGHFFGWPHLTDAIVGARGAWAYYLVSGDLEFLEQAYQITTESLYRAEIFGLFDPKTGLVKGCSSFMESNSGYPEEYKSNGRKVSHTKALSTNLLYYSGYTLCAEFITELLKHNYDFNKLAFEDGHRGIYTKTAEEQIISLRQKANNLRKSIRTEMWLSKEGYYSYVQDFQGGLFQQMEGLGESLALLIPGFETDSDRIESIFQALEKMIQEQNHQQQQQEQHYQSKGSNSSSSSSNKQGLKNSKGGIPCLWPKFKDQNYCGGMRDVGMFIAAYYHNGNLWPFVQGYWAMAAARHGKVAVLNNEIQKLIQLSQLQNTFAEYYQVPALPENRVVDKELDQFQKNDTDGFASWCKEKVDSLLVPLDRMNYYNYTKNASSHFSNANIPYYHAPQKRRRQLWSDTGFIATIFYGIFGMNFQPRGIYFQPAVPSPADMRLNNRNYNNYNNNRSDIRDGKSSTSSSHMSLINVIYRDTVLNITIHGSGTTIQSFRVDDQPYQEPFISNNMTGSHTVVIVVAL